MQTSIRRKVKDNRWIRGGYFLFHNYFSIRRNRFRIIGKNVILSPPISMSPMCNIEIGDNVGIGPNCFISTPNAKLIIKGNCAIAERFTVHTGNHVRIIGRFVTDITEKDKPKGYDKDVVIEKDVWIGCNVTILSGVHVGRGVTIAAGAVVNKDLPPYCVAGGIPAKPIRFYRTIDEILDHEKKIYPLEERLSKEYIESIMSNQ